MFYNGEQVDANSNSIFTVQSLNIDPPAGETARMAWGMVTGAYHWFESTDRHEPFEFSADNVVLAIKGTEFIVEADSAQVTVKVLDGEVTVSRTGASKTVDLAAGEYSVASKTSGAPSDPASFSATSENRWWSGLGPSSSSCCGSAFILLLVPLLAFVVKR